MYLLQNKAAIPLPSLFYPLYGLMAPSPKRICACGCDLYVTRKVELGHLNGQRSALLAADVLSQSRSLLCSHKQSSKVQCMSPARAGKQGLLGRRAPAHQAFLSRKASRPDRPSSENPSGETGEAFFEYDDFPMSEAGPSGVCRDSPSAASPRTINLDESLSVRHSPTPVTVTQDLPPCSSPMPFPPDPDHLPPRSSPMPLPDDADSHDQYSLSMARRSRRITERVERIGRVRWGTNHVQFIEREEREEDEVEVSITEENLNMEDEDEEDGMGCDHDEPEDEEDMPFAEPGQEGISVWDLLGEGFMKEVAEIGWQLLNRF
jgi:hypothetical protein